MLLHETVQEIALELAVSVVARLEPFSVWWLELVSVDVLVPLSVALQQVLQLVARLGFHFLVCHQRWQPRASRNVS